MPVKTESTSLDERRNEYERKGFSFSIYKEGEITPGAFVSARNSAGRLVTHSKIIFDRKGLPDEDRTAEVCMEAVLDRLDTRKSQGI